MDLTRRRALATGATVASAALGGCTSLNPLSGGESGGGAGASGGADPDSGDAGAMAGSSTPTPTPAPAPTTTPAVSQGGGTTETAVAEVEWFVRDFPATVDRYLTASSRALGLVESLDSRASVSAADLDRLETLLGRVETVVYDDLVTHFDARPTIRSYNDDRLSELRALQERSDWEAVQAVLSGMAERYRGLSTRAWVEETFQTDPVGGRLADRLTADGAADRAAVMLYYAPTDTLERVQADPSAYGGALPGGRADVPGYERTFGPTGVAAYRTARAFLTYVSLRFDRQSQPVFLQQYRDADRAAGAVGRMLSTSGAVTAEGTEPLGGQEWRRVFYRANGGVTYAFVLRTGRYVLVAAPSQTAWGERDDSWSVPLELGWFWDA
jgi:hypothetical protein